MDSTKDILALKNLSKETPSLPKNKTLIKAIENGDLSFISELLVSESRSKDIISLSKFLKLKLLPMLVEFLDQPLRTEAIQSIYDVMTDIGNVDDFSRALVARSTDFNKLVFLKGKIDYLKHIQRAKTADSPENEYVEN